MLQNQASDRAQFYAEIERRLGLVPNFFRLAPESPEIMEHLWKFARFAYLDNPLPSLFKERLFVSLSRFCEVRYCIARHVGFLLGFGRPAGDDQCPVQTIGDIIRLIRRPFPRAELLESSIVQCAACDPPLRGAPDPDSAMEEAVFACATLAFLQTPEAPKCVAALKQVFGESRYQHVLLLLAFIRTAHYWTTVHTGLDFEEDLKRLLATHEMLGDCLLNDPEARTYEISDKLRDGLTSAPAAAGRGDEVQRDTVGLDSRKAALSGREDFVLSRQLVERLNHELRNEIGERRRSEAALHESERRFREMIDALPAAIYTTDSDGRLTHFNRAAVKLSGRVPKLGTDEWCVSWKLYYPDGTPMPHEECPMAVALKKGEILCGVEAIAERPDGTRVSFTAYPTPLRDAEGKIVGGINMLVDITERKAVEHVKGRLAAIVESSDDAIMSKDLQGIITSWNKGAEKVFGYTAEETIGRPITMLFPPDRVHEEPQILERISRGERVDHYETVRRRKDGTEIHISLTVSPIRDEAGRTRGASTIARDITGRVQQEEALRKSHADLQAQAEELAWFNRMMVGRELRMIELKKEINELCSRYGLSPRYLLEFEQDGKGSEGGMTSASQRGPERFDAISSR